MDCVWERCYDLGLFLLVSIWILWICQWIFTSLMARANSKMTINSSGSNCDRVVRWHYFPTLTGHNRVQTLTKLRIIWMCCWKFYAGVRLLSTSFEILEFLITATLDRSTCHITYAYRNDVMVVIKAKSGPTKYFWTGSFCS